MTPGSGAIRLRIILAVATALGFFSASQAYLFVSAFLEHTPSFPLLLSLNLSYWYAWAALAPAILRLGRTYPFDRRRWYVALGVHLVGVLCATSLHTAMTVGARVAIMYVAGASTDTWIAEAQRMFFLNFDWEMMTYWAILGVGHALQYHYEARDRALRASQLETRLVEARLQTLQRQLQPHFLFNTLNTIAALMRRDVEAADSMIAKLGDLLRLSLQCVDVQATPLKDELDFLAKYLEIERTRFRDRLSVVFDVEAETLDALVPHLVLQPLVENAIKHGVGPRPTPGTVMVRARRDGDRLHMEVRDDGVGVPDVGRPVSGGGVGLANTRSRLQHLYGAAHRFEIHRPAGGGLAVVMAIPLVEAPRSASATAGAPHMEGVA